MLVKLLLLAIYTLVVFIAGAMTQKKNNIF